MKLKETQDKNYLKSPTIMSEHTPLVNNNCKHELYEEPVWKQYTAATMASLCSLSTGLVGGWSSIAAPLLTSGMASSLGGIGPITEDESSWVASLINLGSVFGALPAGHTSFHYGRKTSLLIYVLPLMIGWIFILHNCNQVWFLYIGRFLCGFSYGSLNVALPVYNNEICHVNIRGRIGMLYDFMQCVGILFIYAVGSYLPLYWSTMSCLIVSVIYVLTFMWAPESPVYLTRVGKVDKAIESIKWLHGSNCDIELEMSRVHKALIEGKEKELLQNHRMENSYSISKFIASLSDVTKKTVVMVFFMFIFQRTNGSIQFIYYTVDVFEWANSAIDPNVATILSGVVQLSCSCLAIAFMDTLGRKAILTFGYFVMAISMAVLVAYVVLIENVASLSSWLGWIPVVTVCTSVGMFRLGSSPIPWFMAPELIPTEDQKWSFSLIVSTTWFISFCFSKMFPGAIAAFGQVAVYSFFCFICFAGFLFSYFVVPETMNKSREQIQRELGSTIFDYVNV